MNLNKEICSIKSIKKLLQLHTSIMQELKSRKVLRTRNNPVADFSEWLVAQSLGLELENNSKAGYDAMDKKKNRYQIKARRVIPENMSTQLGVIRGLKKNDFDFLIGVIFNEHYEVKYAAKIPHNIVGNIAKFSEHQNGHILHLKPEIFVDKRIQNITKSILSNY
jgi:hypothetical protein